MAKTSETKTIFQEVRDELGLSRLEATNLIAEVDNGKYGYLDENKLVKIEHGTVKVQPDATTGSLILIQAQKITGMSFSM